MLPAVNLIRDNFPNAHISFLTSREHAPLLRGFSEVDSVVTVDRAVYRRMRPGAIVAETCGLIGRLRRERYSRVVDFQGYGETGWLTWLSAAPSRWGYVYRNGRSWAYTRGVRIAGGAHPVDRYRELLLRCGLKEYPVRNEYRLPAGDLGAADAFFREHRLDVSFPTLFIQPFTSSPQKNWPLERYLALAKAWRAQGVQVLFGGGPSEREALRPVARDGFPVAAGASLTTAAALIARSTLAVGGDTGLVHMAVAMGKRVVLLIPSGSGHNMLPYGRPDWALEPPPGKTLSDIAVAEVLRATAAALQEFLVPAAPGPAAASGGARIPAAVAGPRTAASAARGRP